MATERTKPKYSAIPASGEKHPLRILKGQRTPLESVAQTVCALLNQQGGTVLWGTDSRGTVSGVPDAEEKARQLNDFLMRQLTPRPLLSVSAEEFKGKRLVLVEIPRGADKPYTLDRRIWVRLGKQARRDLTELEELGLLERSGKGPATFYRWTGRETHD